MSHLSLTQKTPAELERNQLKPHDYYNKYIRKEGQRVLNEEEYNTYVQQQSKPGKMSLAQAEIMFDKMKNNATTKE